VSRVCYRGVQKSKSVSHDLVAYIQTNSERTDISIGSGVADTCPMKDIARATRSVMRALNMARKNKIK